MTRRVSIRGAYTKLAVKENTGSTYGLVPTGAYTFLPFVSAELALSDDVDDTKILGLGPDAQRPTRSGVTVRGTVRFPADYVAIGYPLKMFFGPATVSGTTPKTHTFTPQIDDIGDWTFEFQHSDGASGALYRALNGVVATRITFTVDTDSRPMVDVEFVAQGETDLTGTSIAGTPVAISPTWYHAKQSGVTWAGSPLGKITTMQIAVDNNVDTPEFIGGGGLIGGADKTDLGLSGSLTCRFNDAVLAGIAGLATVGVLAAGWTKDSANSLMITLLQAELMRRGFPISGTGPIERQFDIRGSRDNTAGNSLSVVLVNGQASY